VYPDSPHSSGYLHDKRVDVEGAVARYEWDWIVELFPVRRLTGRSAKQEVGIPCFKSVIMNGISQCRNVLN